MWRSARLAGRDLPAMPFEFDRRDERLVQSVRRLTMTVAHLFGTPGALVALYEKGDQLQLTTCYGIDLAAYSESGFLSSALVTPGKSLIVPDADHDPAFANDVWVTNAGLRFFAGAPMIDASGHPVGMLCIVDRAPRNFPAGHIKLLHDMAAIGVSELGTHHRLRLQEQALQQTRSRLAHLEGMYERLTTGLPIPVFSVDAGGRLTSWNLTCQELFGYDAGEVVGTSITSLLAEESEHGEVETLIGRVFNRRRISGLTVRLRARGGGIRHLYCRLMPIYDNRGEIEACAFLSQDVTARERLEAVHRDLAVQHRLAMTLNPACSLLIVGDETGGLRLHRVSEGFEAVCGVALDPGRPLPCSALLQPEDALLVEKQLNELAPGQSTTFSVRLARAGCPSVRLAIQRVEPDTHPNHRRYLGVMQPEETSRQVLPASDQALLASLSHEIRTPLTTILGMAELLGTATLNTELPVGAMLERNAKRLLETLGAMLEFAQLTAGQETLRLEACDLRHLVADVAAPLEQAARARGLAWQLHLPESPIRVRLDREAGTRAIHAVLSNAVKFTREGEVAVSIAPVAGGVEVTVQDTGVGISDAFKPYLFEAFRQECDGITRPFEGAGLGLAIARRLMDGMRGDLTIESEKGMGTMVTLRFPADPAAD